MHLTRVAALAFGLGRAFATAPASQLLSRDEAELLGRGLAEDVWDEIKDGLSCAGCETLVVLLKGLALLGDNAFVDVLQSVCKLTNSVDEDVCQGAIELEGPIIADAIRNMKVPSQTSKLFCINFLGVCPYPKVTPYQVPFPTEKKAIEGGSSRPAASGKDPIRIVHYSDVHVDHLYTPGSTANCTKPICCRPYTEDDEPGVSTSPAGPNGDHNCDTPVSLEESMYAAINEVAPDAAFVICTGDIVDHTVWNTSVEYNTFSITDAYSRMAASFPLVYGTAGNHEAHPTNAFPPTAEAPTSWVYNLLSTSWSHWIGDAAASSTSSRGSYSVKYPGGNLRVISMNTNTFYVQNYYLYRRVMTLDPDGQIAWLASELDAAEKAGERAYIIGHMPPGDNDAFHDQSNYFDQVVNRYSDTIAAMFFGHTHLDEFHVSYSSYDAQTADTAVAVQYVAPSLTPTSGHPSFRVYVVDPETFAILDAETWIADMADPNFQTTPTWTKFYSAREVYGPDHPAGEELSPAFWHNVTEAFASSPDLLDAYLSRKSRGWEDIACDDACREQEICKLRGGRAEDNCYEPKPGIHFKKRSLESRGHGDDCGVSVLRGAVGSLAVEKKAVELVSARVEENKRLLI
ncbi:related to acid sphingomyelinase [Cephalotrichum gorgonifer]|uniref:Sphingomyelin phosphodiesterase n=1 Tax=Cephalotrichum gorgonifer TaxID=2041049 RepID=A0AAE8MWJ5_9PEZI|nr:related to acid sphingomyelinase [Cephalotrichum gorgonifer]